MSLIRPSPLIKHELNGGKDVDIKASSAKSTSIIKAEPNREAQKGRRNGDKNN